MLFDNDYIVDPAISQSDIKLFETDLRGYFHQKIEGIVDLDIQSKAMNVGNIVDAKILDPEQLENYYVVTDLKATGKVKEIIDMAFSCIRSLELPEGTSLSYPEWPEAITLKKGEKIFTDHKTYWHKNAVLFNLLNQIIIQTEYQSNWGADTKLLKILSLGKAYYEQLQECGDKIMIGIEEWNKAHAKVDALQEHEYTKDLFDPLFHPDEHIKVHKQKTLTGEFAGKAQKGMLDFYLEDTVKMIIYPWDLKTSKSHSLFLRNYRNLKYGRQGAFYTNLLEQNYPGYTIMPFSFLVITIETDERAEIYEMDATELLINKIGYIYPSGFEIKGWQGLMKDIIWHETTGKWDHRREYYKLGKNIINSKVVLDSSLAELDDKPLF